MTEHGERDEAGVSAAVAAARAGAAGWESAQRAQREVWAADVVHEDFYDLARELVTTLRALTGLSGVLAVQVARYGQGRRLRDDDGMDPAERLDQGRAAGRDLQMALVGVVEAGERFWSQVGHIAVEFEVDGYQDEPGGGRP